MQLILLVLKKTSHSISHLLEPQQICTPSWDKPRELWLCANEDQEEKWADPYWKELDDQGMFNICWDELLEGPLLSGSSFAVKFNS